MNRFYYCEQMESGWLSSRPIAHRGYNSKDFGDNSLESFTNSINHGYAIVLDLRYTKDRVPMVIHDDDLFESTGEHVRLSQLNYSEVKKLTIHATGKSIPSFKEVLHLVNGKVPLLIEIKSYHIPDSFERNIVNQLDNYDGDFAIQSYSPFAC
ncbi:MAG: glycerophosphodiester phosphodiesterase family protein, partial [Clostridiaceae bacterium]